MSSNPLSLLEQIKAMSCEDRHKLLNLLNEKESILVKPLNFERFDDCGFNENPYNVKSYQKPVCHHKTLLAPYYYCSFCNDKQFIEKEKVKVNTELFNNVAIEKFFSSM